jgi:hypothetical protein
VAVSLLPFSSVAAVARKSAGAQGRAEDHHHDRDQAEIGD